MLLDVSNTHHRPVDVSGTVWLLDFINSLKLFYDLSSILKLLTVLHISCGLLLHQTELRQRRQRFLCVWAECCVVHVETGPGLHTLLLLLSPVSCMTYSYCVNHMEKLQDLSQSELEELLDNPERVESMALESDEIQSIQLEREMALASNRSLAEQNLDIRPRLETQKELLVARYSKLETFRETYRQHCSQRDGMVGKVSPEAMLSRLQTGSSRTEMESEALADEFLEGSLSLDSFLDRFLSLRLLAHQRRVRIEKLQEILRQKNQANSFEMKPSLDISQSGTTTPWNQQSTITTTAQQQEPNSPAQSHPAGSDGLPYSQYPVPPTHPPPVVSAAGPIPNNSTSGFAPYAGAGSPFTPTGSYPGPRAAFGPPNAVTCPYPAQSSFPAPHPGSAFGQYTPNNPHSAPATYPGSYIYGGYCYPSGPPYSSSQSSPGKPVHRPGYRVPQPYS